MVISKNLLREATAALRGAPVSPATIFRDFLIPMIGYPGMEVIRND